jgi:hypothetical protein
MSYKAIPSSSSTLRPPPLIVDSLCDDLILLSVLNVHAYLLSL